jgi:glycerophosphoryl diester phosphodiesterase
MSPILVAHRGYAARYPENTLLGVEAAVRAGARCVEVDVQLSRDAVPVLMHDATLDRTTGRSGRVYERRWEELRTIAAPEPQRFGGRYADATVPSLAELVRRLREDWPEVTAFVEIKEESLRRFGTEVAVRAIQAVLAALPERCVPISFDAVALACARRLGAQRIGWVLPGWGPGWRAQAEQLAPQLLVCGLDLLPPAPEALWAGPWDWMVYEVTDPDTACALAGRGIRYLETFAVGELLAALPAALAKPAAPGNRAAPEAK